MSNAESRKMRTREEIMLETLDSRGIQEKRVLFMALEVLLDIRDQQQRIIELLSSKPARRREVTRKLGVLGIERDGS